MFLGTDALFPDGIYEMVYTVSGSGFAESVTEYIVLQAGINACYTEAAVTLSQCTCNCDNLDNGIIEMDFYLYDNFYHLKHMNILHH